MSTRLKNHGSCEGCKCLEIYTGEKKSFWKCSKFAIRVSKSAKKPKYVPRLRLCSIFALKEMVATCKIKKA